MEGYDDHKTLGFNLDLQLHIRLIERKHQLQHSRMQWLRGLLLEAPISHTRHTLFLTRTTHLEHQARRLWHTQPVLHSSNPSCHEN